MALTNIKTAKTLVVCTTSFLFVLLSGHGVAAGDRLVDTNVVYPAGAFLVGSGTGGRVIDITHPPTAITPAATGNGTTDDTAAFVSAFNYIEAQCAATNGSASYILYIPNGTYRVTDTLFYNVAALSPDINNVHLVGQSRAGSIIKLDNSAAGFTNHASPKAVLRFSHTSTTFNGRASSNVCQNLTINTGTGNAGAVGIQFQSANSGQISNVTVKSGDFTGLYGVWISVGAAQAYMKDVSITGFDTAVYCQAFVENDTAWEHVTFTGQNVAGVTIADSGIAFRDLVSQQARANVPAVKFTQQGGSCTVLDSNLTCTSSINPAIVLTNTAGENLFARNVVTKGYVAAVKTGTAVSVAGPYISEYKALPVTTLFTPQDTHSFALAVKDTPTVPWETNLSNWVNVEDYRQSGFTDNQTVQAAFAAAGAQNKTVVYFPKVSYSLTQPVNVPASVTRIEAFYSGLLANYVTPGLFNVNSASASPLVIDSAATLGNTVNISAQRTVAYLLGSGNIVNAQSGALETYVEACRNVGGASQFCTPNQLVWGRCLNSEYQSVTDLVTSGGNLWIFGCKTENKRPGALAATTNGVMELLLGYVNTVSDGQGVSPNPMISNANSNMSINGFTGNYFAEYTIGISESDGVTTANLPFTSLPLRHSPSLANNSSSVDIPLYIGGQRPSGPFGIFTGNQDIGTVGAMGSADNYSDSTYFVDGSGSDIGGTADSFQFLSTPLSSKGTLTALVNSIDNTDPGAKTALMFRDGTGSSAVNVAVTVSAANGVSLQVRGAASGSTASSASLDVAPPYWVRLQRLGTTTFAAATSTDGTAWTPLGSTVTANLPASAIVGLGVTAHLNTGVIARSILSNVSLTVQAPALLSAASRLVHGAGGPFDIPLPLTGKAGIECRSGLVAGAYSIVLTFDEAVASGSASISAGTATVGTPVLTGNTMTIPLTGVANANTITLNYKNVLPVGGGGPSLSGSIAASFLKGDANGDGAVTAADTTPIKIAFGSTAGQPLFNPRADLNCDGGVTAADTTPIKTYFGTSLP